MELIIHFEKFDAFPHPHATGSSDPILDSQERLLRIRSGFPWIFHSVVYTHCERKFHLTAGNYRRRSAPKLGCTRIHCSMRRA